MLSLHCPNRIEELIQPALLADDLAPNTTAKSPNRIYDVLVLFVVIVSDILLRFTDFTPNLSQLFNSAQQLQLQLIESPASVIR